MENLDPKAWIERAKYDFKGAEHTAGGEIFDHAVFWCQQAAEKALKAVYIKKTGKLKKVHVALTKMKILKKQPENFCRTPKR